MRRRDRIALILVATVLVMAPFALGGAPRWAICVTSLLSAACAASFLTSKRELGALSPLLAFVGLAALLTLLQVIPLPAALVAILSPGKHQLIVDNARALGTESSSFMPLSLEPPATLLELAKLCGYVAFAYAALRVAATPARRQWLVAVVALVGAAMAVTTLFHVAIGAETVFGLYRPRQAMIRPTLAPLLNHNHLSAMMALTAPIALGLALASSARARLAWLGAAALCASVGLLAESRGGAIALVIGLIAVGVFALIQRLGGRHAVKLKPSDMIAIAVVAMSGLVLLGVLTAGGVVRDLSGTRIGEVSQEGTRFAVWRETSPLITEYRWTGIGRGSFESASTRIHDSSAVVFPHVENEYLQAVVDWGFVGGGALALIMIWLATVAARNARTSPWEAGAFAGLLALAVENITDFSLWMPGIAYPAIAAIAAMTWGPVAASSTVRRMWLPLRAAGLVVVAAAVALAASPLGSPAGADTAELARALAGRPGTAASVSMSSAVWDRHPSSYAAAGLTARVLFAVRDRRAIAVANRALALHPTNGDLHRLTAQMLLASQHRAQARGEYALALRYKPVPELLDEILAAFPDDADAARAMPLAPTMITEWTGRLLLRQRVPVALAYLRRYLSLYPDDGRIQLYTAGVAMGAGDIALAATSAGRAHSLDPTPQATIMLARVAVQQGQPDRAQDLLRQELDHPRNPSKRTDGVEVLLALAEIQAGRMAFDAARETLRAGLSIAEGRQLARVHRLLGDVEERLGNKHQASWERQRANELDR